MYYATRLDMAMLDENTWIILLALGIFTVLWHLAIGVYAEYAKRFYRGEYFDRVLFGGYLVFTMVMLTGVFAMFSVILSSGQQKKNINKM